MKLEIINTFEIIRTIYLGLNAVEQNGLLNSILGKGLFIFCTYYVLYKNVFSSWKLTDQFWNVLVPICAVFQIWCWRVCHSKLWVSAFVKSLIGAATFFPPSCLFSYAVSKKASSQCVKEASAGANTLLTSQRYTNIFVLVADTTESTCFPKAKING